MYSLHFAQMAWADNLVDELHLTPVLQAVIDEMDGWMAAVVGEMAEVVGGAIDG